jgi:hypothetical protein
MTSRRAVEAALPYFERLDSRVLEKRHKFETDCTAMRRDQAYRVTRKMLAQYYPPLGMDMRAMAQAFYRLTERRPEPTMTTDEQVDQFLKRNGLKLVWLDPLMQEADLFPIWVPCKKCEGMGNYRAYKDEPLFGNRGDLPSATVTYSIEKCDACDGHGTVRAEGDPTARSGDWSNVDAWVQESERREKVGRHA